MFPKLLLRHVLLLYITLLLYEMLEINAVRISKNQIDGKMIFFS